MNRIRSFFWAGAAGVTLLGAGCQEEELPTGMSAAVGPATKPVSALKVTPSQLNLSGTGATATLTVTPGPSSGAISVGVSEPPCVSVALKSAKPNQVKYTVTATAAGTCSLLVTDGPTGGVVVQVTVAASPLVANTMAAGNFHTCALDTNGAAYCWGMNGYGQMGNPTGVHSVTAYPTPQAVVGGLLFTSLTAGFRQSCGLTATGAAYCWGDNYSGQLGNTTNNEVADTYNPSPLPVDGGLTFTMLESGNDHVCGLVASGVLYCWGGNALGQLGTTTNNLTGLANPAPTPVPGGLTFVTFAAGANHTCGIATGGAVYCWGDNTRGQLGNATAIGEGNTPQPTPALVQGLPPLVSIVAGGYHNCGLTAAGAAWCWGDNWVGNLGGGTTDEVSPTPVAVTGGHVFTALGAGGGHTCGLTSGGTLYCWGGNLSGQLGNSINYSTSNPNYTPTAVAGLTFAAVGINAAHTCALTAAGQAWCWGFNRYGQIGTAENNGTDIGVPTPSAVLGGLTFRTQ